MKLSDLFEMDYEDEGQNNPIVEVGDYVRIDDDYVNEFEPSVGIVKQFNRDKSFVYVELHDGKTNIYHTSNLTVIEFEEYNETVEEESKTGFEYDAE